MPSTVIKKFEYLQEEGALRVEFATGKIYLYKHVPEEVYLSMKSSFAKGIFFNDHIKDKFEFEKLN
jgi:hypothetical protein